MIKPMPADPNHNAPIYVSRAGLKLAAALDRFELDVGGLVCADLGSNVGGFVDVLLQRGAAQVYAVETGYGVLAWKLRSDHRVVVMERTNAMHVDPPVAHLDLVTIDLAWTPQRHAIPAALRWSPRRIITLIKPHYEASDRTDARGVLDDEQARRTLDATLAAMGELGVTLVDVMASPIRGGKGKGHTGNTEYLALLAADEAPM